MARKRILGPGFFSNEQLAELPFEGRLLFAGLWTLADRAGRLEDRPKRIKAAVFPFDEVDVESLLVALAAREFIDRYAVAETRVIQVAKFLDHQTPHHREPASILPPRIFLTNPESLGNSEARPDISGPGPAVFGIRNTVTGIRNTVESSTALARIEPAILVFPTQGEPHTWGLLMVQVNEWQGLYPSLDVLAECRQAFAWVKANPNRAKTAVGMPKYLVNWLNRSVDRRSGQDRRELPDSAGKLTTRLAAMVKNSRE